MKKEPVELFRAFVDAEGRVDMDITAPDDEAGMDRITAAVATLLASVAKVAVNQTTFVCHAGCVFAAMIELAHAQFNKLDPKEYERAVRANLLTRSVATGTAQ